MFEANVKWQTGYFESIFEFNGGDCYKLAGRQDEDGHGAAYIG
jgi:hypothetical protein